MKKVILTKFRHRDREQLGLQFRYDEEIKTRVEKLPEVRWRTTYSLYYIPFPVQNKNKIKQYTN